MNPPDYKNFVYSGEFTLYMLDCILFYAIVIVLLSDECIIVKK